MLRGDDVAVMRRQLGWSRDDFASLVGASESAVRRWEQAGADEVRVEGRFHDILVLLHDIIGDKGVDVVRNALTPGMRQGLFGLFLLLQLRWGPPSTSAPLAASPLARGK